MRDRILLWNDDNHEPAVWINKNFMGNDFITVIENALNEIPNSENSSEILEIYPWDFKEDDDSLSEEEIELLIDWFQENPSINSEQWDYIFNHEWRKLGKTL
jgi:hypothetical protein